MQNGRDNLLRLRHRGERNKKDAVGELFAKLSAHAQAQTRLPHARWPGQGQQPYLFAQQQVAEPGYLLLTTDKSGWLQGEMVGMVFQGLKRGKIGWKLVNEQLKQVDGMREVFEAVDSQILEAHPRGQMRLHESGNRLREQHLPPVPGAHNARGLMHINPDVAFSTLLRFARMQPDAHAYDTSLGPGMEEERALHSNSSRDRVGSAGKNQKERVSLGIDLVTVEGGAGCSQQLAIVCQDLLVWLFSCLLEQARGPFQVSEEERGGPHGNLVHRKLPLCLRIWQLFNLSYHLFYACTMLGSV